jgi:hypothetical protein
VIRVIVKLFDEFLAVSSPVLTKERVWVTYLGFSFHLCGRRKQGLTHAAPYTLLQFVCPVKVKLPSRMLTCFVSSPVSLCYYLHCSVEQAIRLMTSKKARNYSSFTPNFTAIEKQTNIRSSVIDSNYSLNVLSFLPASFTVYWARLRDCEPISDRLTVMDDGYLTPNGIRRVQECVFSKRKF